MSTLNKLLGLLDKLKQENPDLANKALLASETLKAGLDPDELEQIEDWDEEEYEEDEEEEEEEEFDDSYIECSTEDTKTFFGLREEMDQLVKEYGIYMRDHEVKKVLMLEAIEGKREQNEKFVDSLKEKYRLDPTSTYSIQINESDDGNLVFVKE